MVLSSQGYRKIADVFCLWQNCTLRGAYFYMYLLTVLGLLGLLSLIALIIIYIIKPNYEQKFVSSTYVWKLSLRYRKKRIPISQLRNLLIILCQLLIFVICSFILAQPFIANAREVERAEKIVIIDASASMRAVDGGVMRFDSAVYETRFLGRQAIDNGSVITIIIAESTARLVVLYADCLDMLDEALYGLESSYGAADIDGAIDMAESILADNILAEVILVTATMHEDINNNLTIINVSNNEWNAAILNARVTLDGFVHPVTNEFVGENWCVFIVEVASFNRDSSLNVSITVRGANTQRETMFAHQTPFCLDGERVVLYFYFDFEIYSFESAFVHIDANDAFSYDNTFFIYGGARQEIRVLYSATRIDGGGTMHSAMIRAALATMAELLSPFWDIILEERVHDEAEFSDYDFYIIEGVGPRVLPEDGVVLLIDPRAGSMAQNAGFRHSGFGVEYTGDASLTFGFSLSEGEYSSDILNGVSPGNVHVTRYSILVDYDTYFTPLMVHDGNPLFMVRNDEQKIAVLPFDIRRSTIMLTEFPILLYNLFNYFFPPTLLRHLYDVGERIVLNARGPQLSINGPGLQSTFNSFPYEISVSRPGTFTLTQFILSGVEVIEEFFARIPESESDFNRIVMLEFNVGRPPPIDLDMIIMLAATLLGLLFLERLLHTKAGSI